MHGEIDPKLMPTQNDSQQREHHINTQPDKPIDQKKNITQEKDRKKEAQIGEKPTL